MLWGTSNDYPQNTFSWRNKKNIWASMTKSIIRPVWPAKTQVSLYIYPVWQQFSFIPLLIAQRLWKAHTISKDSDQTAWMYRVIWVFAGHTSYCRFCRALVQSDLNTCLIWNYIIIKWWCFCYIALPNDPTQNLALLTLPLLNKLRCHTNL